MKLTTLIFIPITLFLCSQVSIASDNAQNGAFDPSGASVCKERNSSFWRTWSSHQKDDRADFKRNTGHDRIELLAIQGESASIPGEVADMKKSGMSESEINDALFRSLNIAIQGTDDSTIAALLSNGADANGVAYSDIKPILLATTCQDTRAVDLLKAHGANLYATDKQGIDALWVSLGSKDVAMASHLLSVGFDPCKNHFVTNSKGKRVNIYDVGQRAGAPAKMLTDLKCQSPKLANTQS